MLEATRYEVFDKYIILFFTLLTCSLDVYLKFGKQSLVSLYSSNSTFMGNLNVFKGREFFVGVSVECCFYIGMNHKVDCVNIL